MGTSKDKDFIRQRAPDKELIRVGKKIDFKNEKEKQNFLRNVPAHYIKNLEENPHIKPCCRDTSKNYTFETFKTEEKFEQANMAVFTCTECGCKHYRGAVGPGKM